MNHVYSVSPPRHQPQWPVNDIEPEPSRPSILVEWLGYSLFALIFAGICGLGLLSIMVAP